MAVQQPRTERAPTLTIWVVVLAVIAAGLAGWVLYDLFFAPTNAPNGELSQLLDDYTGAWNDHDGDAFMALVTEDYVFESETGTTTRTYQAAAITGSADFDWAVEQVGDPMWTGDGPWFATTVGEITWTGAPEGVGGVSAFEVVQMDDGTYLVARHVFLGDMP